MELNRDPVTFIDFNEDINKWRNRKAATLYYFNSISVVDSNNCLPTRVLSTKVFNYNVWQEWSGSYFVVDASESSGYTILVNVSNTLEFSEPFVWSTQSDTVWL